MAEGFRFKRAKRELYIKRTVIIKYELFFSKNNKLLLRFFGNGFKMDYSQSIAGKSILIVKALL